MAVFNDLAIELQEAIWELVLPASRGVHWIEIEGIPHGPGFVRDSILMTKLCKFGNGMPETYRDVKGYQDELYERARTMDQESSAFFRHLLPTVPAVFGRSGLKDGVPDLKPKGDLPGCLADETIYTRRCRQLSTYYQIYTLLSISRLSRQVAERYIRKNKKCSWSIHRSMGSLYRPRPMDVWDLQYSPDKTPLASEDYGSHQTLLPRIHALDLVVFRLHDSEGRPTPLLRHGPWQYHINRFYFMESPKFACFNRVALEWHPSWGTLGGWQSKLRSQNVQAITHAFTHCAQLKKPTLYWLVDGVPRPDWERDYPSIVGKLFAWRMAQARHDILEHFDIHWELSDEEKEAMLADHHLNQEFEANGRRYYIVFIVCRGFTPSEAKALRKAGLGSFGPFPGNYDMWPESLRDPVWLADQVLRDSYGAENMGMNMDLVYILSWEPV